MKNKFKILIIFLLGLIISCNEQEFLEEIPLDFVGPENGVQTYGDYKSCIYTLLDLTRDFYFNDDALRHFNFGTDLGYDSRSGLSTWGSYLATLNSNTAFVRNTWVRLYKMISLSNMVISRVKNSDLSEVQKASIEAEARFFRGNSYKVLAHLYGGVPIEIEEVAEPKTDYTRASREEVYQQAITDLLFAAENLPGITEVKDGEICNVAAWHMLAEAYLSVNNYQQAIAAASVAIDDPNTTLMTARFGRRSSEPGDVYWDLFQRENQNRKSGNTEGILVAQYELDVFGGVQTTTSLSQPRLERYYAPAPRALGIPDPNGVNGFIPGDTQTDDSGRGIGNMSPTNHFKYSIWRLDWNDMRNSKYNFYRSLKFTNPLSVWFGEELSDHLIMSERSVTDTTLYWYPFQSKVITPKDYPEKLYKDKALGILTTAAGATYTDQYIIRLAETYLLRAEAYFGNNELDKAAADINVVRSRANATNITSSQVDIDFILDERMRELGVEEKRRLTLARLGLVYDRVSRLNEGLPVITNFGLDVQPFNNLWPIPFSEIESNINGVMEQNPGYSAD